MTDIIANTSVVEAIKQSVPVETVMLGGEIYFTRPAYLPPAENPVVPLKAHTLSAIATYIKADEDGTPFLVHIKTPTQVEVVSPLLGRHNQRRIYLTVDCGELTQSRFDFKRFQEPEEFIIGLLSEFVDTGDRANVLQLAGNLRSEDVTTTSDDGVSQGVTVRKGVSSVAEANVPSIVKLAPFRTFRSVEQPSSDFLLRFRKGRELPSVALFESDGGNWKHQAIANIQKALDDQLSELDIPIVY